MVLLHIILEDMSSQQMLQESNREHRIPYQLNLVDIRKSVIISSNPCHQWSIEYSVESVDIMRSQTLSQGYGKYIKCALCTLYLALSRSILLCAIFVPYLCTRNKTPLTPHRSPLNTHPLTPRSPLSPLDNLPSSLPAEVQHATQSRFYILCKESFFDQVYFCIFVGELGDKNNKSISTPKQR